MLLNILKQFNWVDIVCCILFLRILYIASKNGFVVELFKLFSVVVVIFVAFHYYTFLADLFREKMQSVGFPLDFIDFIMFILLSLPLYFILSLAWGIIFHLFKVETVPLLSRWGGFALGIFRAFPI